MKRILALVISLVCFSSLRIKAQTDNAVTLRQHTNSQLPTDTLVDMPPAAECSLPIETALKPYSRPIYSERKDSQDNISDTLHLPLLDVRGNEPLMNYPYSSWWGIDSWRLHKGLNINLGASVFAAFGKHAPNGAGFGQDLSLMYAAPLTDKLSFAVGGWLSNAYWAHDRYTDAGINAVLGYKFDEHWEATIYGRKSIMNNPVPYHFRSMQELGDRIGASVRYNFSPSFSVQVSVEAGQMKYPSAEPSSMRHSSPGLQNILP